MINNFQLYTNYFQYIKSIFVLINTCSFKFCIGVGGYNFRYGIESGLLFKTIMGPVKFKFDCHLVDSSLIDNHATSAV